ncbi:MAG: LicD family protein, partial [Actinomycetales bacterium]|nr:LicD family protein [Actinomycetales bacterium]
MTSGDTTPPGEVERLAPDGLRGWVRRGADGEYPLVDLVIQGRKVRSLRVVRDLDEERGMFKIGLAESLMRYVPGPEAIVLSVDGTPLPVAETTLGAREDALDRAALDARFTSGHFVTKFGGLRLPLDLDLDWQERTFAHYERCRALMRELFDHDLHVAYGTLLGLEREGGFISSDDDFDTTYHSRRTTVRGVRAELFDIVTTLAARGEDVQLSGRKLVHWYSDR